METSCKTCGAPFAPPLTSKASQSFVDPASCVGCALPPTPAPAPAFSDLLAAALVEVA